MGIVFVCLRVNSTLLRLVLGSALTTPTCLYPIVEESKTELVQAGNSFFDNVKLTFCRVVSERYPVCQFSTICRYLYPNYISASLRKNVVLSFAWKIPEEISRRSMLFYMYIQHFATVVDWSEIGCLMEVPTMLYICRYCVFTWLGR